MRGAPKLVFEEHVLKQVYGPRAIQLSTGREPVLFVGCKDGSIFVVHREGSEFRKPEPLGRNRPDGPYKAGVRTVCEWNESWLLVGRNDGDLEAIPREEATDAQAKLLPIPGGRKGESASKERKRDPVRCVVRLDREREGRPASFLVSFREKGCWRFELRIGQDGLPEVSDIAPVHRRHGSDPIELTDVRFALPLAKTVRPGQIETIWILVNDSGELWKWSGLPNDSADNDLNIQWPPDEEPAILNDFALIRSDDERREGTPPREIFLATDTGVYTIRHYFEEKPKTPEASEPANLSETSQEATFAACRLSLSGLGAMCTALAYAESGEDAFLWTADVLGDSHLFWSKRPEKQGGALNFVRSGVFHAGTQVLFGFLWSDPDSKSVLFGQARRNDTIVLTRYWIPNESQPKDFKIRLRQWLSKVNISTVDNPETYEILRRLDARGPTISTNTQSLAKTRERYQEWVQDEEEHALLAELFELLAEWESGRSILFESLRSPLEKAGQQLIDAEINENKFKEIVQLWTLALMAIAHRIPENQRISAYLGILRWLTVPRNLKKATPSQRRELRRSLGDAVHFTRKWGLHGPSHVRGDLVGPLSIIAGQDFQDHPQDQKDKSQTERHFPEKLDQLIYKALLFERGVNEICSYGKIKREKVAAHIDVMPLQETWLIAVSWVNYDIEFYRLEPSPRSALTKYEIIRLTPSQEVSSSRATVFGTINDQRYILAAPVHHDEGEKEYLHLYKIHPREGSTLGMELQNPPTSIAGPGTDRRRESRSKASEESIYSLLKLDEEWILAGLRSTRGTPTVTLMKIVDMEGVLRIDIESYLELRGTFLGEERADWNPVRSLAQSEEEQRASATQVEVVAGCEGGQIFRFRLTRRPQGGFVFGAEEETEAVARMSSPVMTLAYRSRDIATERDARVFAGGDDGSIVAWEEIDTENRLGRGFASLWATVEQGSICGLHCLPSKVTQGENKASEPGVLAVSRAGRCVLFNDRQGIDFRDNKILEPRRPVCPGRRQGRPCLETHVFASSLLPGQQRPILPDAHVEFLTASEEGTLHLFSLHAQRLHLGQVNGADRSEESKDKSYERRKKYIEICRLLLCDRIQSGFQLRMADALYRSAPILSRVLVRWLLDVTFPEEEELAPTEGRKFPKHFDVESESFKTWWLPRHIRPLHRLRRAWKNQDLQTARRATAAALERAWLLSDIELFKEICIVLLKRANFEIYKMLHDRHLDGDQKETKEIRSWKDKKASFWELYRIILNEIDRSVKRWSGDETKDAAIRMVISKHLVDGDTFWLILREAAEELYSEEEPQIFFELLKRRAFGVRKMVFKRNPLVILETLRAANLSLLAVCRHLAQDRGRADDWRPNGKEGPDPCEVYWPTFKLYFGELTTAAARTFRSRLELNDAVAHEYFRAFALAIALCPSATIRIANRMTEARLIADLASDEDLAHHVKRQLKILKKMNLPIYDWQIILFDLATKPEAQVREVLESQKFTRGKDGLFDVPEPDDEEARKKFGIENTKDLYCLCRIDELSSWFTTLSTKLSTDARDIRITAKEMQDLSDILGRLRIREVMNIYEQSHDFWEFVIRNFCTTFAAILKEGGHQGGESIRPETVLMSARIEEWASDMRSELKRRYRQLQIFQPEAKRFGRILERLERSAQEFPNSAAVQKNIVSGVLGHHMLEDLDEHVLELEDIAQVLDPVRVWRFRDAGRRDQDDTISDKLSGNRDESIAGRFSNYLLRRAQGAQSIPKNLRALQAILESPVDYPSPQMRSEDRRYSVENLLKRFYDEEWSPGEDDDGEGVFSKRVFSHLILVLEELNQNYLKFARKERGKEEGGRPRVWRDGRSRLLLTFPFDLEDDDFHNKATRETNYSRLARLLGQSPQEPMGRRSDRRYTSTGSGLYLANFAASVVGWRLSLVDLTPRSDLKKGECAECTFLLENLNVDTEKKNL